MLLYDRIGAAFYHHAQKTAVRPVDKAFARIFLALPVYDITAVIPLFPDWRRESGHPVPRRPPADTVWCEWQDDEPDYEHPELGPMPVRAGSLIIEVPPQNRSKGLPGDFVSELTNRGCGPDDFIYAMTNFFAHTAPYPGLPQHAIGCPIETGLSTAYAFRPNGVQSAIAHFPSTWKSIGCPAGIRSEPWNRPVAPSGDIWARWFPFMAFSLLHCKNVETVEHATPEAVQRKVRKSGNPPRVTYKTIALKVPETHGPKGSYTPDPEAKGLTRFHLCRGHFKNLTHPRFKTPGLHWWPAHWRGNAEQGTVITDRRLVPAPGGES